MKLEYLAEGSADCPLIRLYDFTPDEVARLGAAVARLASGTLEQVEVHGLAGLEVIANCRLTFRLTSWNQGIVRVAGAAQFECGFSAGGWEDIAALIEPFSQGAHGFQWLAGVPGEAMLLLSVDGEW